MASLYNVPIAVYTGFSGFTREPVIENRIFFRIPVVLINIFNLIYGKPYYVHIAVSTGFSGFTGKLVIKNRILFRIPVLLSNTFNYF